MTAGSARGLPRIAVTIGDPAGIGPEIVPAAARDERVRGACRPLVVGPETLRPADCAAEWMDVALDGPVETGRASAAGGAAALAALRRGHELALAGEVAALVTGPVSKRALHLAGERVEGQTELLGRWCGVSEHEMLAVAGRLRVMPLTRHTSLARALESVTTGRVLAHLHKLAAGLAGLGLARPRLALAGLNPHAGEEGLFGDEEREVLAPAVARARDEGLDVSGPLPADTVFVRAARGEFDGVLALYHDQAFIPVKLLGADSAVTVLCGLPYLRVSPAHGVAFDIAGRGLARPDNLIEALLFAAGVAGRAQ